MINRNMMLEKINRWVAVLLSIVMGVMLLGVLWQVFTRDVMAEASTVTGELARFGLIWIGLLGAAYISAENAHLDIDLLPTHLSDKNREQLAIVLNSAIILLALAVSIIGGTQTESMGS